MKILLISLSVLLTLQGMAQQPGQVDDSISKKNELIIISSPQKSKENSSEIKILRDTTNEKKENTVSELFIIGRNSYKKADKKRNSRYPAFEGHWSGFNYGFVNFANTDYSMYDGEYGNFMDLNWSNSFAMQFNLLKYSINLVPRNNFGLVCGIGLEYQRLRFENNYLSVTSIDHKLVPVDLHENKNMDYIKRSTFKTLYLTIPLLMEVQIPAQNNNRFYFSGGIMGGLRMHSKTKVVYKNEKGNKHKKKEKDNFNMAPFKADITGSIGYRGFHVWGSYTLTNMFKADKGPELHAYTIGIGATF